MSHGKPLYWYSILLVVLLIVCLSLYGRTLRLPFVQDDWIVLQMMESTSPGEYVLQAFSPAGKLLYRPLGMLYFLLLFSVFHLNPIGFHIAALLLHTVNALLVALIVERLTGRRIVSASVALLYIAATTIHGDTLLWMVGYYDLGASFFLLSGILLYLDRRPLLSAAAFLLAILTKEAAAPLVMILLAHAALVDRTRLRLLLPHGAIILAYSIVRLASGGLQNMDPASPYRVAILGAHLWSNSSLFLQWGFGVVIPFWSVSGRVAVGVVILAVAGLSFLRVARRIRPGTIRARQILFLLLWIAFGVSLVLLLTHHLFRYYAVYSLPPLLLLWLLYGETMLAALSVRRIGFALAFFLLANIAANWLWFHSRFDREPSTVPQHDGTNHLIRKASQVDAARLEAQTRYPSLPKGAQLVLSGFEVEAFGKETGPRLWYRDESLRVFTVGEFDSLRALGMADSAFYPLALPGGSPAVPERM